MQPFVEFVHGSAAGVAALSRAADTATLLDPEGREAAGAGMGLEFALLTERPGPATGPVGGLLTLPPAPTVAHPLPPPPPPPLAVEDGPAELAAAPAPGAATPTARPAAVAPWLPALDDWPLPARSA